jgi:hypothetical protein
MPVPELRQVFRRSVECEAASPDTRNNTRAQAVHACTLYRRIQPAARAICRTATHPAPHTTEVGAIELVFYGGRSVFALVTSKSRDKCTS